VAYKYSFHLQIYTKNIQLQIISVFFTLISYNSRNEEIGYFGEQVHFYQFHTVDFQSK